MKRMFILIGLTGSGKSTWAERTTRGAWERKLSVQRCSADDFYGVEYKFDASKLGEAHQQCFRRAVVAVAMESIDIVIVDNTNSRISEIAPYVLLAESYRYDLQLLRFPGTVEQCLARGKHRVPEHTIRAMQTRLDNLGQQFPPHWPRITELPEDWYEK